jgi:hypothetical protein
MFSTGSRFIFRTTGTVDAVTITGSTGAYANSIMTINGLNQGNQNGLRIINLGSGDSGILIQSSAGGDAVQFTPNQMYQTNRNFTFTTSDNAYDSGTVAFTFRDFNKPTLHYKSFLIQGSTRTFKSGSYFEVQKSGSIPILHLAGDAQSGSFSPNELYISGSLRVNSGNSVITGSLTVASPSIGGITIPIVPPNNFYPTLTIATTTFQGYQTSGHYMSIDNPGYRIQFGSNIGQMLLRSAGDHVLQSGASNITRLFISSTGNIGIAKSSSLNATLDIIGNQIITGSLSVSSSITASVILNGMSSSPSLNTTARITQTNSGSFVVYSLPTASYDTAFFEYSIRSVLEGIPGPNARAGTIMAIQSGSSVNFTETTTTDFGNTSPVSFTVVVTGSNMALTGSSTTGSWTIKTIIRTI